MDTIIIKPKDQSELEFFLDLAKRLGTKILTIEGNADERLFQKMEENKKTKKVNREKVLDTLNNILRD